jgi:hypothetical protein
MVTRYEHFLGHRLKRPDGLVELRSELILHGGTVALRASSPLAERACQRHERTQG